MNVMEVARTLGLVDSTGEVAGTVDQQKVLDALAALTEDEPTNADLFNAVAEQVQRARSAGSEDHDLTGLHVHAGGGVTTQLRYRSEMSDLFTDLAIDVGLRHQQKLIAVA